jgi:ubiquitin-protein ligase E3 D
MILEKANGTRNGNPHLECSKCHSELGLLLDETSSATLYKWRLAVDGSAPRGQPSLAHCVSEMLIATLARSGCSKSIVMPLALASVRGGNEAESSNTLLHIWLFNKDITFSSTESTTSPVSAIKVLYRLVSQADADEMIESMTSNVQDVNLPESAIQALTELLRISSTFLPEADRVYSDWHVGLLDRWRSNNG